MSGCPRLSPAAPLPLPRGSLLISVCVCVPPHHFHSLRWAFPGLQITAWTWAASRFPRAALPGEGRDERRCGGFLPGRAGGGEKGAGGEEHTPRWAGMSPAPGRCCPAGPAAHGLSSSAPHRAGRGLGTPRDFGWSEGSCPGGRCPPPPWHLRAQKASLHPQCQAGPRAGGSCTGAPPGKEASVPGPRRGADGTPLLTPPRGPPAPAALH